MPPGDHRGELRDDKGTTVYTIAYGAASSGCSTDTGAYPFALSGYDADVFWICIVDQCTALLFRCYCLPEQGPMHSRNNPNLSLTGIFGNISAQLTRPRLIPNTCDLGANSTNIADHVKGRRDTLPAFYFWVCVSRDFQSCDKSFRRLIPRCVKAALRHTRIPKVAHIYSMRNSATFSDSSVCTRP